MKLLHFSKSDSFFPKPNFKTFDGIKGCYFYEVPKYKDTFQRLDNGWSDRVDHFFEIDDQHIEESEPTGGETEYFVKAINLKHLISINKPIMKEDWE